MNMDKSASTTYQKQSSFLEREGGHGNNCPSQEVRDLKEGGLGYIPYHQEIEVHHTNPLEGEGPFHQPLIRIHHLQQGASKVCPEVCVEKQADRSLDVAGHQEVGDLESHRQRSQLKMGSWKGEGHRVPYLVQVEVEDRNILLRHLHACL